MFISAREVNRSVFILLLSQFCNLLIDGKLLSHSEDVTSNVHTIFLSTNTVGNIFSSPFFTDSASVEGRDSAEVKDSSILP